VTQTTASRATSRTELVRLLLDQYVDVERGIQESRGDDPLALMCRAWNHPSFQRLIRLRLQLRDERPDLYWHVAETYLRCGFARALECPDCDRLESTHSGRTHHTHGTRVRPRLVQLTLKRVRVVRSGVDLEKVEEGISWIAQNWEEPSERPPGGRRNEVPGDLAWFLGGDQLRVVPA